MKSSRLLLTSHLLNNSYGSGNTIKEPCHDNPSLSLPYVVLTGNALSLLAILSGLNRALAEAAWRAAERRRAFALTAAILLGWLAIAYGLAASGFYHVTADGIPTIQYGVLLPIIIGVILIWRSDLAHRIIDALPQAWI